MRENFSGPWERVRSRLRAEYGEDAFKAWLLPMQLESCNDGEARILVPSVDHCTWVNEQYRDRISHLLAREIPGTQSVCIEVCPTAMANGAKASGGAALQEDPAPGVSLDSRFTFDNFVVGPPNALAYTVSRNIAESDTVTHNPLYLYSGVGLGKTHLLHAIAWHLREHRPDRRVAYLSAERFMREFVRALRFNDAEAFKNRYRSVDVLIVDDVQFLAGKDSTQEEFFHTFNALVEENRQIIVAADKSPGDLNGIEEHMRSRLGWGMVANIDATTYELRLDILRGKAQAAGVDLPDAILEFLAERISSNVRELEGAFNRIVADMNIAANPPTLERTRHILRDTLRTSRKKVMIEDIQRKVADYFNIRFNEMMSSRRAREVVRPRQIAMYLAKQLTARSLPEIGRKFGGRDHTTVIHAVRRIEELMAADRSMREEVEQLKHTFDH